MFFNLQLVFDSHSKFAVIKNHGTQVAMQKLWYIIGMQPKKAMQNEGI